LVEKKPRPPRKRNLERSRGLVVVHSIRLPQPLPAAARLPAEVLETSGMETLKLEVDANLALVFPRFRIATKPVKIHQEST
jgi:hypothetical protein